MKPTDGVIDGEQQVCSINAILHAMIRSFTKNMWRMSTRMGQKPREDAADDRPHEWNEVQYQVASGRLEHEKKYQRHQQ